MKQNFYFQSQKAYENGHLIQWGKNPGLKIQETRIPGLALPQMSCEILSKSEQVPLHLFP